MQSSKRRIRTPRRLRITRRGVVKIGLIASGLLSLRGLFEFLSFKQPRAVATRIVLQKPESYPPSSVTPVPEVRAWLLRDEGGLYALSAVCTHLGCTVAHNGPSFECPCHGSAFDLHGAVISGPAERPLAHVEVKRTPEGFLLLDTEITVPTSQRLKIGNI